MKAKGMTWREINLRWIRSTWLIPSLLLLVSCSISATPLVNLDSPLGFFTNVAGRLLRSEFNLDLTRIQVYPTNQYTPAVHRLLQVTANVYDAATNHSGVCSPQLPSVFRPLFRRDPDGAVFITGYREVTNTAVAYPRTAPQIVELDRDPGNAAAIPPLGIPFGGDSAEPLVSGVPLVVGARKGLPNFNEFAMQTSLYISRLLEFRRGRFEPNSPVSETNQMYVMAITNAFGLEAWNSYSNPYPRNLQLMAAVDMTAILTNELGQLLLSNRVSRGAVMVVTSNSWAGWVNPHDVQYSFRLPWGITNKCVFLSNSTYVSHSRSFEPQTHVFERGAGFFVPRWWLLLNSRVRFILVDTEANRIVDYVNLNRWERPLEIFAKLLEGFNQASLVDYRNPGNQWITNRLGSSASLNAPTFGVMNQILAGLNGTTDRASFALDPTAGSDVESAVDGFRYNLMSWAPIYARDQGKTFYKSNIFYAPFDPYRPIFIHTSWQANDPLVHYTIDDLRDLKVSETNRVNFAPDYLALSNLGLVNPRYEPWGVNPFGFRSVPAVAPTDLSAKDPLITRSDFWDFPSNRALSVGWLGQVHRGTPWQTLFLKSANFLLRPNATLGRNLSDWQAWTGNALLYASQDNSRVIIDAFLTLPTNDWHLASLLTALFNTNEVHSLLSVNEPNQRAWAALQDGMVAQTNLGPGQLASVLISSNSWQVATITAAIEAARLGQPAQLFLQTGDIPATPELSIASPWLNGSNSFVPDAAFEILPEQLLPRLRPDSIGTITWNNAGLQIRFTGFEGARYEIEASSDLEDWDVVATNFPVNGAFVYFEERLPDEGRFYRSRLAAQPESPKGKKHPHKPHPPHPPATHP